MARRPPMIQVIIMQQQILHYRFGSRVGLPAPQLQGKQGIAGRVRLAALALSLKVILPVSIEECRNELRLFFQILVANGEAPLPGRRQSQERDRLIVTSKTSSLRDVPFRSFEQQRQRLADRGPDLLRGSPRRIVSPDDSYGEKGYDKGEKATHKRLNHSYCLSRQAFFNPNHVQAMGAVRYTCHGLEPQLLVQSAGFRVFGSHAHRWNRPVAAAIIERTSRLPTPLPRYARRT